MNRDDCNCTGEVYCAWCDRAAQGAETTASEKAHAERQRARRSFAVADARRGLAGTDACGAQDVADARAADAAHAEALRRAYGNIDESSGRERFAITEEGLRTLHDV